MMISRALSYTATHRNTALAATLAAAAALSWAGGALSGENPRFDATIERIRAEAAPEPQNARRAELRDIYLGRAPWICTPSGFGQTATCFERGDMQVSSTD